LFDFQNIIWQGWQPGWPATLLSPYLSTVNEFELPVQYKGEELLLQCTLIVWGYTHKVQVQVNDIPVLFEPDEERNYRALVEEQYRNKTDISLLQNIATALHKAFR
jgi:hypothetical protein